MKTSIEKVVELIYSAVPYPSQVSDLDFTSERGAIRFKWRGVSYRVSESLHVEEIGDGVLIGSDRAIMLGALFEHAFVRRTVA